jgi:hypothetical protein
VLQFGLQECWLEGGGLEVVEVEPAEFDAGFSVRGAVGPGVVEDGGVGGGDGVDEGELVVVRCVEVEEVLDDPEQVPDPGSLPGLFEDLAVEGRPCVFAQLDPPAGEDPGLVLIRLRQEHVPVVNGEAGDPVFEARVLLVEGDHDADEFIRKRLERI